MSSAPEELLCPITYRVMQDPVICETGITYERSALLKWLQHNHVCPVTLKPLNIWPPFLVSNLAIKSLIDRLGELPWPDATPNECSGTTTEDNDLDSPISAEDALSWLQRVDNVQAGCTNDPCLKRLVHLLWHGAIIQ